jgi:hypothetical protein
MASNQDIALYKNDLYAADGDFAVIESDVQHVTDTLAAVPGWWKENPADGVGVMLYLRSSGQQQALQRNIKIQLLSDGYRADAVQVTLDSSGQLTITPNAEKL